MGRKKWPSSATQCLGDQRVNSTHPPRSLFECLLCRSATPSPEWQYVIDMSDKRKRSSKVSRWEIRKGLPYGPPPGRTNADDSVDASSEDPRGTEQGYRFTGYDSPAATRIGKGDKPDRVERLRELNEGRHQSDGKHSIRQAQQDKRRIAQAVCSDLPLNRREKSEVVGVVEQLDFDQFGNQKAIAGVTLGTAAVVVDEHKRKGAEDPDVYVRWSDQFRQACESIGVKMSDLNTIKQTIREQLDNRDISISGAGTVSRRDPLLPGPTSPGDRPSEYWDNISAQRWVDIAKMWERLDDEFAEAVPERYENRVNLLRKWKPWSGGEDGENSAIPDS